MTTERRPRTALATLGWYGTREERDQFLKYWNRGGTLSFNQWKKQGKPAATVSAQAEWLTPRARETMGTTRYAEAKAAQEVGLPIPSKEGFAPPKELVKPPAGEDAFEKAEREKQERENARWEREFALKERELNEKIRLQEKESGVKMHAKYGINPYDNPQTPEEEGQFNPYSGEWEPPQGWMSPYQQGQLSLQEKQMEQEQSQQESLMGWYREQAQMQQQEQERQYRSQLMANPMSWLQYSSYTGQAPVVQEWMKPLMSGQYQTGQQIPGWTGGGGEGQAMGSLPELRTPSAQLWSRMGPTAQSQYMGYGQARTGIRPEETAFRLGATAPPSGNFGGLRRMR